MIRLLALSAGVVALMGVLLAVIVAGAVVALAVGRSAGAVLRWLRRSALAAGIAGLGGVTATVFQGGGLGLLTALVLFVLTLALLPGAPRLPQAASGVPRTRRKPAEPRQPRATPDVMPADPLDDAWSRAAAGADWAQSRIAVARTSCERLLRLAEAQPLDQNAADWAGVIRRRVPELVDSCLAECASATPAERHKHLDHLVEALERIGGEADRRRSHHLEQAATPFGVQRTYVAQRTAPDPLAPDG